MSICIISDHMIILRKKIHYNPQYTDQVKPKSDRGGFNPQCPPPRSAPETQQDKWLGVQLGTWLVDCRGIWLVLAT